MMSCFALTHPPPKISGNECQMSVQSIAEQWDSENWWKKKTFLLYLNIYSPCLGIETEITNRTL